MLDDDTLISVPDISFAFSVWKVMSIKNLKNVTADFSRQTLSCFTVGFHSNFQTRLLDLYRGNMSQRQQECTAMAALSCRIQKQQEVTCRLFVFGFFVHIPCMLFGPVLRSMLDIPRMFVAYVASLIFTSVYISILLCLILNISVRE